MTGALTHSGIGKGREKDMTHTVAFAGNPNVGKSTVFNALTGLRQHTGNWTGKTVELARGRWTLEGERYEAVDLPGVYSLEGGGLEERIAAEYLENERPEVLVVVLDATALERTLALALELRAIHPKLVICLNMMDEADRLGLKIDCDALSGAFAAPVIPTRADRKGSVEALRRVIAVSAMRKAPSSVPFPARQPRLPREPASVREAASALVKSVTVKPPRPRRDWDRIFLGKWSSAPILLLFLFFIFYLTVWGSALPSALLEGGLTGLQIILRSLLSSWPEALRSLLLDGVYGTVAKVVAVMLPPMAIFFPLFSLLEDLGFLPRAALLVDRPFSACGACGRQGLCMCMGLGCNAVGVMGCRIIPNEKERLAAVLTNVLVPCNGRFPTLILLAGLILGQTTSLSAAAIAGVLTGSLLLSGVVTLVITALLRHTILRGKESAFLLELPPFRRPRLGRLLLRSVLDRTLRVLGRAVTAAAPAGMLIWLLNRIHINGAPLLRLLAREMDPFASLMGISGTLLLAFGLSFPANELLLPLALLISGTAANGDPAALFVQNGSYLPTALCAAIFTLFHWPCAATVLTIRHETGSLKWTLLSILLPALIGMSLCMLVNAIFTIAS